MCGIFGVVNYQLNEVKTPYDMSCVQAVLHRGPDEGGNFYDKHVFLGHRRLSVVDIEQGKQPMAFHHYTMVYNGELYNTEEIRQELLEAGYTFKGHSDTEVLLKAYVCFGEKVVEKLNGIYAFAVWNSKDQSLYVARDRAGVKPLYYCLLPDGLIFASEQKQILQYTRKNEITLEGFKELLGVGPSHTPGHGLYKGIEELKPGYYMKVSAGHVELTQYWELEANEHKDDFETTVAKTREILLDAIKRQLVSDVPLCTFLSGGIDSSAITAIAASQMKNLHTFSIDYEDNLKYFKKTDFTVSQDNDFIKLISDLNHTNHHYCVISNQDLADALTDAVHFHDMPGMADVDSSLYWFCKKIKEDFTVSLSGECADEIFGGYPWFYREPMNGMFPWLRDLAIRNTLLKPEWQEKLDLVGYATERFNESVAMAPILEGDSDLNNEKRQLTYLNTKWFMTTLLDRKDRMSMGASLEVRVPFADHRLMEYLYNIPWEMKFYDGMEKGLLRKALEGVLPDEVLYRKKNPYPKTHNPHYTELIQTLLREALSDSDSILHEIFDEQKLWALANTNEEIITRPWFGQLMTQPQLIAYLYQFHVWFKEYHMSFIE
ncbi:asparagine synthase (glutamine-hydrolyzing) [Turicibacter sp. H121]|uniref:asparagine synthase (glutamine-hydrolyzing) n=1 Tax=Turicibacter sp. H121 TaxID=1712675 RepID=UPI0007631F52|nr:asparagine synthase (glutamine-hydrolyzing) [Turicibacter sp. H121]AMC07985.1 asparagine synthetase B [Turicibacter sp. H121]MCU7200242.1 asparagine synthase (glutamine-hydrolyzing) [Turicibacter sp. H121]